MITQAQLKKIIADFGLFDPNVIIDVDGDIMTWNGDNYVLTRPDGVFNVTGLGWGFGTLYVGTKERGTVGIRYEHELTDVPILDDDLEPTEEEPTESKPILKQSKLERWFMGVC